MVGRSFHVILMKVHDRTGPVAAAGLEKMLAKSSLASWGSKPVCRRCGCTLVALWVRRFGSVLSFILMAH